MDGELRFEPSSLRLPRLLFQLTELLRTTPEPGRLLPCTDCAAAERGVLVKAEQRWLLQSLIELTCETA